MLKISDITKFTLQDYPESTACIIWFAGCNMRCKYCHNVEFFENIEEFIKEEEALNFLKKRVGLFDGVVLSGGECTLNNELKDFIIKIKNLGFKIKIDTNGLNFKIIKELIEDNLIDFVALDFKAPFNKFKDVTQTLLYDDFNNTLKYLINKNNENKVNLEIRTTVHTSLLQENDINGIINILDNLKYSKTYYIQNFRNDNKKTLFPLGEQKYIIDKNKIKSPINFKIDFRNFF